jgi:hypothetical protein
MWVPIELGNSAFVTRRKNPDIVKVALSGPSRSWVRDLPGAQIHGPVELLADETILTRMFREDWPENASPDARISYQDGSVKTEFHIGEAMHIQADMQGQFWAGYSDEGIYSGRSPLGGSGLICFDTDGRVQWDFLPPVGFDPISECYVLNCTNDAVWVCYYTDFPIMRIDSDFRVTAWTTDLSGPSQMAVHGDRLLVYGGYRENANDCWLLHLREYAAERIARVQLCLPPDVSLDRAEVIGRGRGLHVFANDLWFHFEVPLV